MRSAGIAVLVIVLAACTQAPHSTSAVSPQASAASPSPVADLPVTSVGFSCRLPVTKAASGGDYASYEGGFIKFPEATYTADPASAMHSEYLARDFVTTATPALHGSPQAGPPFYDLALKRWVPVGAGQSSPDGSSYAYGVVNGSTPGAPLIIHVVDVKAGTDRTFNIPATSDFGATDGAWVGDYDGSSVFFSSMQSMGPLLGVWKLDVATGSVHQMSKVVGVVGIDGSHVWVNRIDPRDPQGPQTGHSGFNANSVVRIDLATGQELIWYFNPGHLVSGSGTQQRAAPLINDSAPPDFNRPALHLVSKPESDGITIYDGMGGLWFGAVQSDILGRLWLGNDRGIYLWTPAIGLQKVFAFTHDPVESAAIEPAGLCT